MAQGPTRVLLMTTATMIKPRNYDYQTVGWQSCAVETCESMRTLSCIHCVLLYSVSHKLYVKVLPSWLPGSKKNTLWEFVLCVGTLESWACRRLEYPKSPGGLMQQNWSNWSNWRIDATKLIKLEQLGQQFKPKCRYVCTTSWMGLRWPANVKMTNQTNDRLL